MIKKRLFIIFWICIVIILLLFSFFFRDQTTAIVAQVVPMKKAISYHKAIRIEDIFVIPGQTVKPGDLLVKVTRPDLILDVERKNNSLERLKIEYALSGQKLRDQKYQLSAQKDARVRKIEAEIAQMKVIITNNQELSSRFGSLTGFTDTVRYFGSSYYEIEIDALEKEKEFVMQQFDLEVKSERSIFETESESFRILSGQLEKEIEMLNKEESELIKRADIHGTIGNVNVQDGELLSPYTTILSIYESKPTIIKAFMNEGFKYSMAVGKKVTVESTNRKYSIEGSVSEIGARIVEYPNRLKTNLNIPMWGQELFIKIPDTNNFLNGERVIVLIKE